MMLPDRASSASGLRQAFDLSLFVAGSASRSLRTIQSVKRALEEHAPGRYRLRVVDIYRQPELAVANQIVAVPTLVCTLPQPTRFFVGHLATPADVLRKLSILLRREEFA